jgi:molybdenum cofactor biosynthesis protein B
MNDTVTEHKSNAPQHVRCAVITVSDTRTRQTDRGGKVLLDLLASAGHKVVQYEITPDDPQTLSALISQLAARPDTEAILITGGTGISRRDQTYETVSSLLTKVLPGYGELFRHLSYEQIGPASMLSRAVGGVMEDTVVLTMPGSPAAVELAMRQVILPELGHLIREARR